MVAEIYRQLAVFLVAGIGLYVAGVSRAQSDELQLSGKEPEAEIVSNIVATAIPPQQIPLEKSEYVYKNGYQLKLLDKFSLHARVLSKRLYFGDERADIAPVDLAVGWGKLADPAILKYIQFRQNNRFLYWHVDEFPIPRKELESSATNIHMIPANGNIEKQAKSIKRGQVISLRGFLVDAKAGDNAVWPTSRSREDSGEGACEILYVNEIVVHDQ